MKEQIAFANEYNIVLLWTTENSSWRGTGLFKIGASNGKGFCSYTDSSHRLWFRDSLFLQENWSELEVTPLQHMSSCLKSQSITAAGTEKHPDELHSVPLAWISSLNESSAVVSGSHLTAVRSKSLPQKMLHWKGDTVPRRGWGRSWAGRARLLARQGAWLCAGITWLLAEMRVLIWWPVWSVSYFARLFPRSWDGPVLLPSSSLARPAVAMGCAGCGRAVRAAGAAGARPRFKAAGRYFGGGAGGAGASRKGTLTEQMSVPFRRTT